MHQNKVFRILLTAGATDNRAEQLLNLLRRSGLSLLARDIQHQQTLSDILASEPWHMLLIFPGEDSIAAEEVLQQLQTTQQDIPCVVISDGSEDIPALLKLGAAAVYTEQQLDSTDGQGLFVHRVQRELEQLEERREKRRLAVSLKEIEQRYHALMDATTDAVACINDGIHVYCNDAYAGFFGFHDREDLLNQPFPDLVADDDVERVKAFLRRPDASVEPHCAFRALRPDGSTMPAVLNATEISYQGERCLQLHLSASTGNVKRVNEEADMAGRDLVTDLAGHRRMEEAITQAITDAVYRGEQSTLLVAELDEFNEVSGVLGRNASNMLLMDFGRLLAETCPSNALVGRMDESGFAVLLHGSGSENHHSLLERIATLDEPLQSMLPKSLRVHLSTGVTVITDEAPDAETLLVRAEHNRILRMKHRVELGTAAQNNRLLNQLEQALEGNGVSLVYQPVVSLHADGVERYEVRARIQDGGQLLQPGDFLEIANQHGLGLKLDQAVMTQVMELLEENSNEQLRLIINLTQNSITSSGLLSWLTRELQKRRLNAQQLILQFSEIDALSSPRNLETFSRQLAQLGIDMAVTHFGCALDPFHYLNRIPVQYAKLDRSLTTDVDRDANQRDTLQHLISGLHARGVLVIAPMIERMEILPLLWQAKINFVQGNCLRAPSASLDFGFVQDEEITLNTF